jgi:hypothetical protein
MEVASNLASHAFMARKSTVLLPVAKTIDLQPGSENKKGKELPTP